MSDHDAEIIASWDRNADAWARAIREQRIPSRIAATDRAILDAVRRTQHGRVLDAGCGEGWLARALGAEGYDVTAIDASEALIARARELGGGRFSTTTFEDIIADARVASGPYEVIVLNFALLGERIAPLLAALSTRLSDKGVIIVQTVHPWTAGGDQPYGDGWRVETFDAFGGDFAAPMPWFFRTLASWVSEIAAAGLTVQRLEEPVHPQTGRQLSLLLTLAGAARPSPG